MIALVCIRRKHGSQVYSFAACVFCSKGLTTGHPQLFYLPFTKSTPVSHSIQCSPRQQTYPNGLRLYPRIRPRCIQCLKAKRLPKPCDHFLQRHNICIGLAMEFQSSRTQTPSSLQQWSPTIGSDSCRDTHWIQSLQLANISRSADGSPPLPNRTSHCATGALNTSRTSRCLTALLNGRDKISGL